MEHGIKKEDASSMSFSLRYRSVALSAVLALLNAPSGHPQSPPSHAEFEAASIKPNASGSRNMDVTAASGGRFGVSNAPLRFVLRLSFNVKDFQILGGPAWINSEPYDITAKAGSNATLEQIQPMLQSLLADRFKLLAHRETRELPAYNLVAAKSGLKLAASKDAICINPNSPPQRRPGEKPPLFCGIVQMGRGAINAVGTSMPRLLIALSAIMGRTIIDKTGFGGTFDIHMQFAPDEAIVDPIVGGRTEPNAPATDSAVPSIFTVLQEQLGLRLESTRAPGEVLVIDHVERPSAN